MHVKRCTGRQEKRVLGQRLGGQVPKRFNLGAGAGAGEKGATPEHSRCPCLDSWRGVPSPGGPQEKPTGSQGTAAGTQVKKSLLPAFLPHLPPGQGRRQPVCEGRAGWEPCSPWPRDDNNTLQPLRNSPPRAQGSRLSQLTQCSAQGAGTWWHSGPNL